MAALALSVEAGPAESAVYKEMAPQVEFEPTTLRLTAGCSALSY